MFPQVKIYRYPKLYVVTVYEKTGSTWIAHLNLLLKDVV